MRPASAVDMNRSPARSRSRFTAPLLAAILGIVLLYGAGFAQDDILHNGAHDARHAAGFACH